jgi:hypothetical protein
MKGPNAGAGDPESEVVQLVAPSSTFFQNMTLLCFCVGFYVAGLSEKLTDFSEIVGGMFPVGFRRKMLKGEMFREKRENKTAERCARAHAVRDARFAGRSLRLRTINFILWVRR